MALIQSQQPPAQFLPDPAGPPVAREPPQIFVDADERERPGPRTGRAVNGREGLLEQPAGHAVEGGRGRHAQDGAQRPQGPAMAVVRAAVLPPVALVVHEVAKASGLGIEGVREEGEIA